MTKAKKVTIFTFAMVLMFTSIFSCIPVSFAADTASRNLVAYYKFDSDYKDYSGNGNDAEVTSGQFTFASGVVGKGIRFDGSSYLEVNDSDSLDLDKNFTISVWLYKDDVRPGSENQPILSKLAANENEYPPYALLDDSLYPCVRLIDKDTNIGYVESKNVTDLHKWYMLTVTYDGQFLKFYRDGVLTDNSQYTSPMAHSGGKLLIGCDIEGGETSLFKGVMDELRIYNYNMPGTEISALYAETKNDSIKPSQMVAYYKFDEDLKDYSGVKDCFGVDQNGTAVTSGDGITYVNAISGKGAKFDGSSYIEVEDSNLLDLDKNFTFSSWVYNDGQGSDGDQPILTKLNSSTYWENPSYTLKHSNERLSINLIDNYGNFNMASAESTTGNQKWTFITVTYDGKYVKFYRDGVLISSESYTSPVPHSSGKLLIGSSLEGSTEFFKGILDELRIYNYILKADEVKKLYDTYNTGDNGAQTTPSGEQNLKAAAGEKSVSLEWSQDKAAAGGYYIYRSTESKDKDASPITDFPITDTKYVDKNVQNGVTYYYVMKPVNSDKTLGEASNEVSVIPGGPASKATIVLKIGDTNIKVNGESKAIDTQGSAAALVSGRTFVPASALEKILPSDSTIEWNSTEQKVTLFTGSKTIVFWIGKTNVLVNGVDKVTDVAPYVSDTGKPMLPLRFIVENLNWNTEWDGAAQQITINR